MLWLFGQTWIWILIAFILGLVIGFLVAWLLRKKEVDVTEERIPAARTASASADHDADADAGSTLGLAAGGAAAGGAVGLAGSRDDSDDSDDDTDGTDGAVTSEAPALDETEPTQVMAPGGSSSDQPALSMIDAGDTAGTSALGFAGGAAAGSATDASADTTVADTPEVEAEGADTTAADTTTAVEADGAVAGATVAGTGDTADATVADTPEVEAEGADTTAADTTAAEADDAAASTDADTTAAGTAGVAAGGVAGAAGSTESAGEVAEGPYGPGSARPLAGGAAPSPEFTVKGNADSMLFHTTESPYYRRTKAEVWFKTPADAEAAGFTAWSRPKSRAANGKAANGKATKGKAAAPAAAAPVVEAPVAETPVVAAPVEPVIDADLTPATGIPMTGVPLGEVAAEAETGRIPAQTATLTAEAPAASPHGPNSALPLAGGAAPSAEYTVKGNADSMLFHTTDSPYYSRTVAEVWFKTAGDAEAAGFTQWTSRRKKQPAVAPAWQPGSYPGSALPNADGSAPAEEFTVKGNEDSMLFHTTESPYYPRTRAEVWFKTAADAESAGFTAWNRRR